MSSKIEILLVLVLYKEQLEDTNTYKTLCLDSGEEKLFVWDNSPVSLTNKNFLRENVIYTHCPQNLGLGCAYNRAAEYAKLNNIQWLLLLDQDTKFPNNILKDYREYINQDTQISIIIPKVKISGEKYLSPIKGNLLMARPALHAPTGFIDIFKYYFINSGIAIKCDTFLSVGGYNENVKLDFSDIDFIHKLRKSKNEIIVYVLPSICFQNFSNQVNNFTEKINRFKMFCESVDECSVDNFYGKFIFKTILIKRSMSLSFSGKSIKPILFLMKHIFKV